MSTEHQKITGNIFDYTLLKRVMRLALPYKASLFSSMFLAITLAILAPFRSSLVQVAIDDYVLTFNQQGLFNMVVLLAGLLMAESLARYFFIYITRFLGQSVIKDLRKRVFDHVVRLRLSYFDRTPIGTSTTRTVNDVETINDIFSQGLLQIFADLLLLVAVVFFMFYKHWQLAFVSLTTLPILIYVTYIFKERVKGAFQKVRTEVSRLNAFLQEHITGMSVVQIFAVEEQEYAKFKQINSKHRDANVEAVWYYSIFFPAVEILLSAAVGFMVWYGATALIKGNLVSGWSGQPASVGTIIEFILYINMLFRPIRFLADRFNTLQMGLVASDRIFRLIDTKDIIPNQGEIKTGSLSGNIEFKNVWLAYNKEEYILKNISFSIQSGEMLAIVGPTGSGKSSIINIINRLYPIQQGKVLVDGHPFEEYELSFYRSSISTVLQDVFLFSGSILDNIRLRSDISEEKVIQAAKLIGAHDFIKKLPGGYHYQVMERGATLSMGQRQLISFVRALVFDPSILILDEATSSIDTESEYIIQSAIHTLTQGRTSIIVAHRLSTIQNADKILVIENGHIAEFGTHDTLLAKNGAFKKLYDTQLGSTAEE